MVATKKASASTEKQTTVDDHFPTCPPMHPPPERVLPYSDELFKEVAHDWLTATDQPIWALQHPTFHEMIDVASRAPTGVKVKIPDRKVTHQSSSEGKVSTTCDGWQASNDMNTSHSGVTMACTLFKVLHRVGILRKMGWITCDNVSNNDTMLTEFAKLINDHPSQQGMRRWDPDHHHIQAKFDFDGDELPESSRDLIAVIHEIGRKVRSSSKHKHLFKRLQSSEQALLLIDMFVKEFLDKIWLDKTDTRLLHMQDSEWNEIIHLISILMHADEIQQKFSSENDPTLHLAIPLLESLHKKWSVCMKRSRYSELQEPLKAGVAKLKTYYEKTSDSAAYVSLILKRRWIISSVIGTAVYKMSLKFKERYEEIDGSDGSLKLSVQSSVASKQRKGNQAMDLSDDEDDSVRM
ncbi:hypothetical protein D9758_019000 [Tetrapyrgos nigripes]|uniref:Uncharacterized protein n=1 Tax=Tetrapyrgos nigripes TaxID=182062 RepID=A0A8H5ER22_9AGAR|nr:hypothetical protein D9758_019000 [Tetrapyrgos nigripes]